MVSDGKRFVKVSGEEVAVNPGFKLYMVCRGKQLPDFELQTRCSLIDFSFTRECMVRYFTDVVFECELPSKRQEYLLICDREVEAMELSRKCRFNVGRMLVETETNLILDNTMVVNSIFENLREMGKSDDRAACMKKVKRELHKVMDSYARAAVHAAALYEVVDRLRHVNVMYEYDFDWFVKVYRLSIENSNKSKLIDKRLRYLKDHLTFSLFCQVSNSLRQEHRLVFAFLLCCNLLVHEARLDLKALFFVERLFDSVFCRNGGSDEDGDDGQGRLQQQPEGQGNGIASNRARSDPERPMTEKPDGLPWLSAASWAYVNDLEIAFPEAMKGEQ